MNTNEIFDAIVSHASTLGIFEQVNFQPLTNTPTKGLSADITIASLTPINSSGINSVSACLEIQILIVTHLIQSPENEIDKAIFHATDLLLNEYCTNFTFNNELRNVDIFGADSAGIQIDYGFVEFNDTRYSTPANRFRAATIRLPLIINDIWEEVA